MKLADDAASPSWPRGMDTDADCSGGAASPTASESFSTYATPSPHSRKRSARRAALSGGLPCLPSSLACSQLMFQACREFQTSLCAYRTAHCHQVVWSGQEAYSPRDASPTGGHTALEGRCTHSRCAIPGRPIMAKEPLCTLACS